MTCIKMCGATQDRHNEKVTVATNRSGQEKGELFVPLQFSMGYMS